MFWSVPCGQNRPLRHSVHMPCQVVRERDFRLIADGIENLSVTGLLVTPADSVLTGERLIVSFQSPRWGIWIDAEATVARVIHGRRRGEFARKLGLQFESLDPWSRFVLEKNLRWIPMAPPAPPRRSESAICAGRILAALSGRSARPLS
jgi:hypothetical protein